MGPDLQPKLFTSFLEAAFTDIKRPTIDLDVVEHACNPSYAEGKGKRITIQSWPRQKYENLSEKQTKSKKTTGVGSSSKGLAARVRP
jgi:hypothetical protein